MLEHVTLVAFVAVVFAFHAAVAWLARRRAGPVGDERADRLADDRLRCPDCGVVNELAFQFCAACVRKLQERAPTAPVQPAGSGSLFR